MEETRSDEQQLRQEALLRLKKKRDFQGHLMAYVMVNAFIVVIWMATSGGFFWPVFPIIGWGIGLIFHAWDVYGGEPTEADVEREMQRLKHAR